MSVEQHRDEISAEALITKAIDTFGIDVSERERLRGIPRYSFSSLLVGETTKYRAAFEHSPMGDELITVAYPSEVAHARDCLTKIILSTHPLRKSHAEFIDIRTGESPLHLEGLLALDRISVFLIEAQADSSTVNL